MAAPTYETNGASHSPVKVGEVTLPTAYGTFSAHAYETATGHVYLALVRGDVDGKSSVLTRLHSECLTGDALGSLRCDCGVQLHTALRTIAGASEGVLLYLTGHEGRGIGLVNKLRAYIEQDLGADTLDANLRLGLPADDRDYGPAGAVLSRLGVRSVRLLSNNPAKAHGLEQGGITVDEVVPLATAAHVRNRRYLETKQQRFGHVRPLGADFDAPQLPPVDVMSLLGEIRPRLDRPYVLVKFAQTLDGRIATGTGDSKWISGEPERRVSHALRAACDAVLVGVGTVRADDPELTVRMVAGASPIRVVLDSTLRMEPTAKVASSDAATMVLTTDQADPDRRAALLAAGVAVYEVEGGSDGVDVGAAMALLRRHGVESLMVEGGSRVITSLLAAGIVDRLVVSISPTILGAGVAAVGPLGVRTIADGIHLRNRSLHVVGDDVLVAWDVDPRD
jgi:3,4-dihydroxy 2-butanone 4-phosphate synthase/GTP cyclohydrolase II